jgi:hypothetical protein
MLLEAFWTPLFARLAVRKRGNKPADTGGKRADLRRLG